MAALVQTITTQQSAPLILQSSTSSGSLQGMVGSGQGMSQGYNNPRGANSAYGGSNASSGNSTSYRGYTSSAPIAPYAFTSTPVINTKGKQMQQAAQQQQQQQKQNVVDLSLRQRSAAADSISSASSASSEHVPHTSTQVNGSMANRQQQALAQPTLPASQPTRPSPDRYRRNNRKAENAAPVSSPLARPNSIAPAAGAVYQQRSISTPTVPTAVTLSQSTSTQMASDQFAVGSVPAFAAYSNQYRSQSADDIHTYQRPGITAQHHNHNRRRSFASFGGGTESLQALVDMEAKNNRRASLQSFPMNAPPARPMTPPRSAHSDRSQPSTTAQPNNQRLAAPQPAYGRRGSSDSANSASSGGSARPASVKTDRQGSFTGTRANREISGASVPPRGSSNTPDVGRRVPAPSPLSKPVAMTPDPNTYQEFPQPDGSSAKKEPAQPRVLPKNNATGTAADRLAAISMDNKKSLKHRLRRALSFGSAAELRKVAANASQAKASGPAGQHEELDEESARVARQQEATGLGEGIYSGQGNFFGGSTDNISVSSTASSASIMLRKMGKGMKRSTRSLVGLFRPKSMVGLSTEAARQASEASSPSVAIVNVEAERENVNVNANPHDQPGGGTGFPKLERASMDRTSSSRGRESRPRQNSQGSSNGNQRPSIIGSDQDRQEVLASLKKGILKRSGSSSPIIKATDSQPGVGFQLPHIPSFSPNSPNLGPVSAPIRDSDYFTEPALPAAMTSSSSVPSSPRSHPKYGVTFSPRITFHDTWTAGEYDRKGEVATCNRLTPMLAQQIKEELNTFKMEMDVHEESRVYTHFF